MLIDKIRKQPLKTLQYIERYVNDGSPSGFFATTSPRTNPYDFFPWFNLYVCSAPDDWVNTYGEIPTSIGNFQFNSNQIFLHPDMIEDASLVHDSLNLELIKQLRVIPTSSARTVQISDARYGDYIKLHYNQMLGRVNRALPYKKAIAGPEISRHIVSAVNDELLCNKLLVLPEIGARVLNIPSVDNTEATEWGMIWRSRSLLGPMAEETSFMVPFFALFSTDRLVPYDLPIFIQVIENSIMSVEESVIHLLQMVLDCYTSLVGTLGLQPEWNAQNLLVGFDYNFNVVSIIMRDMGEIEKDFTIRSRNGLDNNFDSAPYKCINETQETYRIRHSFEYDFKLGEYILEPIIRLAEEHFLDQVKHLRPKLKEIGDHYLQRFPDDFFPQDGKWYKHDDIVLTGKRPYIAVDNPKFRSV